MKHFLKFVPALLFAVFLIRPAGAVSISYTLDFNENTNSGQYNYTISNDSDRSLDGFRIYFDYGSFEKLSLADSNQYSGWNFYEPFDPYQDTITIWGTPITVDLPGEIRAYWDVNGGAWSGLLEFSVLFSWLGDGTPGAQEFLPFYYDLYSCVPGDPDTCYIQWPESESDSGDGKYYTDLNDTSVVPEPQTFMLLGTGILAIAAFHRRNISRKTKRRNM